MAGGAELERLGEALPRPGRRRAPSARSPARARKRIAPLPAPRASACWPAARVELERLQVVVGEHVGQVFGPLAGLALEPGGRRLVPAGAGGARDLPVADVADQQVPEAVLGLARHRAELRAGRTSSLRASSCSACSTSRGSRSPISASAPAQNTLPITEASCSRLLRSAASVSRRAAISACTESGTSTSSAQLARGLRAGARTPPHTAGCRPPAPAAPAASRAGSTARSSSAAIRRAVSSSGERSEVDRGRVAQARPPRSGAARSSSGRAVQSTSSGTPSRPVGQVLEEGEQGRVRPVQVLEHEHRRPLRRPATRRSAARR